GNLDWKTGEEVAELLVKLNKDIGMAMVVATHNQRLASKMSAQMEIVGGELI
ncbi:MAG: ABC transporter ATP-binding protein, partial [Deltaproteobacteria bacterium]|nr:ABC transporter ATP-binding protein [Deltaproteobacteria bacterium]